MADYIKVSSQRIGQDRASILGDLKEIKNAISSLENEMELLGQTWEGPAWNAFQNQVASDIENMQLIYDKLSDFMQQMEYAQKSYAKCETKVEQLIKSIRV